MAKELSYRLLTFAEGGEPARRRISLSSLLRGATAVSLRGTGIRCELDLKDDLHDVVIDEGQINQVLNNLISNSKEAMPDGGAIRVSARNVESDAEGLQLPAGAYVEVTIADNGRGIPAELMPHIFDPYFSTKEMGAEKGRGLGLSICHSVIKKHGGLIMGESLQGSGSSFRFYLPAAPAPEEGPEPKPEAGYGRILLMDDEEIIRDIAGEMLRRLGYDITVSPNGEEAVEAFRHGLKSGRPFDAVILDLTVQGGSGAAEAVKHILELDPSARCIVSSGYADDPILKEFGSFGFASAVAKPYTLGQLSATLRKVIG